MTCPNIASINNYGNGILIDAVTLVDPVSEVSAADLNNLRNDCSAMTSTAIKCIFQFTGGSSPVIATTAFWPSGFNSLWGTNQTYIPTVTYVSTGVYTITLPAQVPDQLGNMNLISIRFLKANNASNGYSYSFTSQVTSANTVALNILSGGVLSTPNSAAIIFCEVF